MIELKWVFVFMFSMVVMFIGVPFTLAAIESYEMAHAMIAPNGLYGYRILLTFIFCADALLMILSIMKMFWVEDEEDAVF